MRSSILIFTLSTSVCLAGFCRAQDEPSTSEKKSSGNLDVTIELMSTIMIQLYEKAGPSDEQRAKIRQVIDANIPGLVRARDRLQTMFSPEQQKMFNAAIKLANNAKYSPDKAEAYALKKLKLPEAEMKEYIATKKQADGLQMKMDDEIAALLSDEQKAKLPMFQTAAAKTSLMKFKLPNMKTYKDSQTIWQELMKIKGATQFKPDIQNQSVEFRVPDGTPVNERLAEMVEAGNVLVAGWEAIPLEAGTTPKAGDAKSEAKGSGSSDKATGADGTGG